MKTEAEKGRREREKKQHKKYCQVPRAREAPANQLRGLKEPYRGNGGVDNYRSLLQAPFP